MSKGRKERRRARKLAAKTENNKICTVCGLIKSLCKEGKLRRSCAYRTPKDTVDMEKEYDAEWKQWQKDRNQTPKLSQEVMDMMEIVTQVRAAAACGMTNTLPDGTHFSIPVNSAMWLQTQLGGTVVRYVWDENKSALIGCDAYSHTFLLLPDYIVDVYSSEYNCTPAILHRCHRDRIAELYGDVKTWKRVLPLAKQILLGPSTAEDKAKAENTLTEAEEMMMWYGGM